MPSAAKVPREKERERYRERERERERERDREHERERERDREREREREREEEKKRHSYFEKPKADDEVSKVSFNHDTDVQWNVGFYKPQAQTLQKLG